MKSPGILRLMLILRWVITISFILSSALFLKLRHRSEMIWGFRSKSSISSVKNEAFDSSQQQILRIARKNLPSPDNFKAEKGIARRLVKVGAKTQELLLADRASNGKILIEKQRNGKKLFRIEGLPRKMLKEVRNFLPLTTPSTKVREELAEKTRNIYDRRRQRLIESCEGKRNFHWNTSMQLIAAPDKDLTVCVVQKAGSSNWHRMVYDLRVPSGNWTGDCHATNRNHGIALPGDVKNRLMTSNQGTRVLTVRHPFARIISGWNDKFHKNHLLRSTRILTASHGIEKYIGVHEPDNDHIIAFEDFVQYLVDRGVKKVDPHFQSIEVLCSPCDFPYDFITKAETTTKNLWWVLDRVGASMPAAFSKRVASGSGVLDVGGKTDPWEAEKKIMSAFFSKIPRETIKRLKHMYETDFIRFGYNFDVETVLAGDVVD